VIFFDTAKTSAGVLFCIDQFHQFFRRIPVPNRDISVKRRLDNFRKITLARLADEP
jgi:hypothetical protein